MNIKENIEKQINAGFTREEIYQNLLSAGFSREQVDAEFPHAISFLAEEQQKSSVSGTSIFLGILFIVVVFFRIARFGNTGSALAFLSIITGIGMAIYFFTKRG